jgi:type IV pilus biogenesis protein CpaD/CtpE
MIKLLLAACVATLLTGCASSDPPGTEPNYWTHQLGLEGGGG